MVKRASTPPIPELRIKKVLRLLAYCGVVGVAVAALSLGSAYAGVEQSALELGAELGKLDGAGSQQPILLNGEPIYVSSAVQDVPIGELLDRVEARCEKDASSLAGALPSLPAAPRRRLHEALVVRAANGILRKDEGDRGVVVCLTRRGDAAPRGVSAYIAALSQLLDTGDLGELGDLRYVFAERTKSGSTHVVTAWTDGPFHLYSLLPTSGDAPGSDLEGVPRPENAVRMLTATIEGVPYSVRIYSAPGGPEQILARYDREMADRAWRRLIVDGDKPRRVYTRAGVDVYIFPRAEQERSFVTLVQMRGN